MRHSSPTAECKDGMTCLLMSEPAYGHRCVVQRDDDGRTDGAVHLISGWRLAVENTCTVTGSGRLLSLPLGTFLQCTMSLLQPPLFY
jgi:hypothetical protein